MGGPYSGSSLARFVRVGAVATGITYGFVVSGVWSLVRLLLLCLLLRLFLFLLFCALCASGNLSRLSLEFYIIFRFFLSSRKLTAAVVCTRRWYSHFCEQVKPSPKSAKKH